MTRRKGQPRRYAEGTDVDPAKSKADIETLVTAHGATGFLSAWADQGGKRVSFVQFQLKSRMLKYPVIYPLPEDLGFEADQEVGANGRPIAGVLEAEWRRRWRAVFLIIKAKLEILATNGANEQADFDRQFMADILLPNGQSVGDAMLPRLVEAYESGNMPPLLPTNTRPEED